MHRLSDVLSAAYPEATCDTRDGIKLDLPSGWVQIRKSNTEPIMRIYAEGPTSEEAESLADRVIGIVKKAK